MRGATFTSLPWHISYPIVTTTKCFNQNALLFLLLPPQLPSLLSLSLSRPFSLPLPSLTPTLSPFPPFLFPSSPSLTSSLSLAPPFPPLPLSSLFHSLALTSSLPTLLSLFLLQIPCELGSCWDLSGSHSCDITLLESPWQLPNLRLPSWQQLNYLGHPHGCGHQGKASEGWRTEPGFVATRYPEGICCQCGISVQSMGNAKLDMWKMDKLLRTVQGETVQFLISKILVVIALILQV